MMVTFSMLLFTFSYFFNFYFFYYCLLLSYYYYYTTTSWIKYVVALGIFTITLYCHNKMIHAFAVANSTKLDYTISVYLIGFCSWELVTRKLKPSSPSAVLYRCWVLWVLFFYFTTVLLLLLCLRFLLLLI